MPSSVELVSFKPDVSVDFGIPGVSIQPTLYSKYDPYSAIDLTQVDTDIIEFNTEEYWNSDADGRPSLGLFFTKDMNISQNEFTENIPDELFSQIKKENLVTNGNGRIVKQFHYFTNTLGEGGSGDAGGYSFKPAGGWDYIAYDGVGYNLLATNTQGEGSAGSGAFYSSVANTQIDSNLDGIVDNEWGEGGYSYMDYFYQDPRHFSTENGYVVVTDEQDFMNPNPFELIPDLLPPEWGAYEGGVINTDFEQTRWPDGVIETIPAGTQIPPYFYFGINTYDDYPAVPDDEDGISSSYIESDSLERLSNLICNRLGYDRALYEDPIGELQLQLSPRGAPFESSEWSDFYYEDDVGTGPLLIWNTTDLSEDSHFESNHWKLKTSWFFDYSLPDPQYYINQITCQNVEIQDNITVENISPSGQRGYAGYYPYIVATEHSTEALSAVPPTQDYLGSLNIDYQWAKWVKDPNCHSYNRCLKFKADENYQEITNLLNDVSDITTNTIGSLNQCSHNFLVYDEGGGILNFRYNDTDTCNIVGEKCAGSFTYPMLTGDLTVGDIVEGPQIGKCVNPQDYINGWFAAGSENEADWEVYSQYHCNAETVLYNQTLDYMNPDNCYYDFADDQYGGIHKYCVKLTDDITSLDGYDGSMGDDIVPYFQCVSHINPGVSEGSFELQAANEVLALTDGNQYRTINQYQQIYDKNNDTFLNPFSSLKVSFWMKTTNAQGYTGNPDQSIWPSVESSIVKAAPKIPEQTLTVTDRGLGSWETSQTDDVQFGWTSPLINPGSDNADSYSDSSTHAHSYFQENNYPENTERSYVRLTHIELRGSFNQNSAITTLQIGGVDFANLLTNMPTGNQGTWRTVFDGNVLVQLSSDFTLRQRIDTENIYGDYTFSTYVQGTDPPEYTSATSNESLYMRFTVKVVHKVNTTASESSRDVSNPNILYSIGRNNSISNANNTILSPFGSMNRFKNSKFNEWEKFEYDFNLTENHLINFPAYGLTSDGQPGDTATGIDINNVDDLYFTIQASMNDDNHDFYGTVFIDDIKVEESYDFIPDCDVRKKKGPNDFGIADLTQYYDKDLQPEAYVDTTAPMEVQFYFYPRYKYDNFLDSTPSVIFNDFREGMFYLYDVDWGDGSLNEFTTEPELLGPNTSIYHTYENHGIFDITGTILRMKPNKDYEPIGIIHNKKFELRININEGRDEDFEYFGSDGFSFIPYKETVPTIGGYGEQSLYYKSVKRQLGILSNDMVVESQFKNEGDRLKTEIALNKMTNEYDNNLYLLDEFAKPRYDLPNETGPIIYNGLKLKSGELGKSVGDLDITNIKYFNTPKAMWEILGFDGSTLQEIYPVAHWTTIIEGNVLTWSFVQSNWNVLLTHEPGTHNTTLNLDMRDFPKLDNGFVDAYIEGEVLLSDADWHPIYIEITSTTNLDGSTENRQGFRKYIPTDAINPGTENQGTWIGGDNESFYGTNYFKIYIGDDRDGGAVSYMPANTAVQQYVTTYEDRYDFNRIQIGRTVDCTFNSATNLYEGDCSGNPDAYIGFSYLGIRPGNVQLNYLEILAQNQLSVDNNVNHPGNPDGIMYWKRIIPKDYSILNRDGINQDKLKDLQNGVITSGSQIITIDSNQDWLDENNDGMPDYYYPVLPKYSIDGKFTNIVPTGSMGELKIEFPQNGIITDEEYIDDTLKISINSFERENNIFEDYSGNKNHGFNYNDYKPIFDKETLQPKKTKNINQTKTTRAKGAF